MKRLNICITISFTHMKKGILLEYMEFCGHDYAKILKHVSTSCKDVYHTLIKYSTLKSYFLSEEFADQRFSRMQHAFSNPLTEVALPFPLSSFPLFRNFNKLL